MNPLLSSALLSLGLGPPRGLGACGGAAVSPLCITMLKDGLAELGREESVRVLDVAETTLPSGERRSAN